VQHLTSSDETDTQEGREPSSEKFGEQEYVGMKASATTLLMMTPMGWNTERQARRNLLFCGGRVLGLSLSWKRIWKRIEIREILCYLRKKFKCNGSINRHLEFNVSVRCSF
jgi:hypothetical protein